MEKVELTEDMKKEIARRIHRSASMQRAFSGEDGELALKEIDILSHYKGNTFDPDPYQSAYNAGQRSIAVFIHLCISQDIQKASQMLEGKDKK